MDSFSEERNPNQKWLEIENMQFATMKYEIIRKLMALETVEVNLLKSAHYY